MMKKINLKNSFYIILVSAFIAALFSPLASVNPDGLDWTVEKHAESGSGINAVEKTEPVSEEPAGESYFIFGEYKTPFIKNESVSTVFSGFAGIVMILMFFKIYSGRGKKNKDTFRPSETTGNPC